VNLLRSQVRKCEPKGVLLELDKERTCTSMSQGKRIRDNVHCKNNNEDWGGVGVSADHYQPMHAHLRVAHLPPPSLLCISMLTPGFSELGRWDKERNKRVLELGMLGPRVCPVLPGYNHSCMGT
jgi:hypothetical protein